MSVFDDHGFCVLKQSLLLTVLIVFVGKCGALSVLCVGQ